MTDETRTPDPKLDRRDFLRTSFAALTAAGLPVGDSKVKFVAEGTGRTLAQAAVRFSLSEPAIASVLPNIVSGEQLREYAAGSDAPALTPEELTELHRLYDEEFVALEAIQPQRA